MYKTMKNFTLIAVVAVALIALAACDEKETNGNQAQQPIAVQVTNAAIVTSTGSNTDMGSNTRIPGAITRATDTGWKAGDAIALTLFKTGTATIVDGKTAYKYVCTDATEKFSPADAANTAYYPAGEEKTDVIAFYPYREIDAGLLIPVSTTDQKEPGKLDLMVAEKSTGHSADNPGVKLSFSHRLVKLSITVDREVSAEKVELDGASLTIEGIATRADWNLADATLHINKESKADISIPATYSATTTTAGTAVTVVPGQLAATAIVLPAAAGQGVKLKLTTTAGQTFEAALPATAALVAGTVNTLRMHLQQAEATIEATVTDWVTGITADLPALNIAGINTRSGAGSGTTLSPTDGDELQVMLFKTSNATTTPDAMTGYTYSAGSVWTSTTPIYWDGFAATETGIGVRGLFTPAKAVDAAAMAKGEYEKDYLLALPGNPTATDNLIDFGQKLTITMTHATAQVRVELAPSAGFTLTELQDDATTLVLCSILTLEGSDARSIALAGISPKEFMGEASEAPTTTNGVPAGFTPAADVLTNAATLKADNSVKNPDGSIATPATAVTFTARILPQKFAAGTQMAKLTIGGQTYTMTVPAGNGWTMKPGVINTIKASVSKSGIKVADGAITIAPWGNTHTGSGEFELD